MKRLALIATLALWSGTGLLADFSYDQTTKITGGMMAGMMKFAGAFSKQAREPMKSTMAVKGDRMAHIMGNSAQIIDLGKQTVTHIDFQKKTYSVLTFEEYSKAIEALSTKMRNEKGEEAMDLNMKASVKETGEKRNVAGMDARQVILTIEMEGTDKKTGKQGVFMTMTSDMWLAPVAGYEEVREFYKRMSQKINWAPSMGMMAPQGSAKGFAEMAKEMSKLDGVPVYQVMKMGSATPPPGQESAGAAAPPQQQPAPQEQQAEQEKPSSGGALGRLAGGRLGGLGGFGRKKKQEDQQQASAQSSGGQASGNAQQGAPGSLIEMTSEFSAFSTASVDASKFDVPAGFKQVESEMLKATRR